LITYIYNGTSWLTDNELLNATDESYYLDFNPSCSYKAGSQNWNMTVSSAGCQKNKSSSNFVVNIIGELINNITQPDGSTNFTINDLILLRAFVDDDCSVNMSNLDIANFTLFNGSSSETYVSSDEGTGFYNYTWNSAGKSPGAWNVTFNTGNSSYNTDSFIRSFFLSSTQTLTSPSVSPSSGGWGVPNYTYSITVNDADSDSVTVNAWVKNLTDTSWTLVGTDSCNPCSNTILSFNKSYLQTQIGNWSFKFNATDSHGNNAETAGGSHIVSRDTISIFDYEGNNSQHPFSEARSDHAQKILMAFAGYSWFSAQGGY